MKKREWKARALAAERRIRPEPPEPSFHTVTLVTGMDGPEAYAFLTVPATDGQHTIDLPAMGFRMVKS